MLKRLIRAGVLISLLLALSSCSAVTSAYVVRAGPGEYQLVIPPQCATTITSVVVKYSGDPDDDSLGFDDLETIWAATADRAGRDAVTLLDENDGYVSEWTTDGIDADARVVIGWTEVQSDGDEFSDSLAGTLADIGEGDLLWYRGVTSRRAYDRAAQSPLVGFSC